MFCSKCGNQVDDSMQFCSQCGTAIPAKQEKTFCVQCGSETTGIQMCNRCGTAAASGANAGSSGKKRHGFTTFWLLLSVIGHALSALVFLAAAVELFEAGFDTFGSYFMFFTLTSIGAIVGCAFLLRWKKSGFWVVVGMSAASFILSAATGIGSALAFDEMVQDDAVAFGFVSGIIGIAILWGVLHIRKNGKTAWEQLE